MPALPAGRTDNTEPQEGLLHPQWVGPLKDHPRPLEVRLCSMEGRGVKLMCMEQGDSQIKALYMELEASQMLHLSMEPETNQIWPLYMGPEASQIKDLYMGLEPILI